MMSEKEWGEQASEMMRSWAEAQRTLWDAWTEMAYRAAKKTPTFNDVADEWQKLATQSLQAWGEAGDPIARRVAEQFVASQGVMLRFVDFAAQAWESAAPKLEAGADWQAALQDSMEQLRQRWLGLPAQAEAITQDMEALWQLYLDQWRAFGQPWGSALSSAPGLLGRTAAGDPAAMVELSEAYRQAYQQTLGKMAQSPNLGMARESTARLQEGFDAFVTMQLANVEYQAVMAEIWEAAFKQFGEDLAALAEQEKKIESVRELVLLWTRGAEGIFLEAFRGERYTLAQGKLLNATMQYRIAQGRLLEDQMESLGLPTRSEVDEAHRRIYELRKELKALKKQVAELKCLHPNGEAPQPKRRTAGQKKGE